MQDRFKVRFPIYQNKKFKKFVYSDVLRGQPILGYRYEIKEPEQCTGLKDKNGKLIYEGDIISRNGMYRKVFWLDDEGGFGYEPSTLFEALQTQTCEITGNIHDNPELLEKSD